MTEESSPHDNWVIYIIQGGDGSYYTGITKNIEKRFKDHVSGKGSKYLRGRGPLDIVFKINAGSHSLALKYEIGIKKLSRNDKLKLISDPSLLEELVKIEKQ